MLEKLKSFRPRQSEDKKYGSTTGSKGLDEVDSISLRSNRSATSYAPTDVEAKPAPAVRRGVSRAIRKSTVRIRRSNSDILPNPGVSSDDKEYFMGNKERGVALIFSHENFDVRQYSDVKYQPPSRSGTEFDRDSLRRTFQRLGFQVRCFDDPYYYQITNELRRVANENHKNRDCVAVAVLSHGEQNGNLDARDREYHVSELWEPFTARQCPSLAGKPKLFFIQACRGPAVDQGVMVSSSVSIDGPDGCFDTILTYPVPCYADILVSYSTFEGLYSFRNPQNGAWYIQTLCDQLEAHGMEKELLCLLTDVNRIVGQSFRSRSITAPEQHNMVQSPSFTSSLTRCIYFRQNERPPHPPSSPQMPPPDSSQTKQTMRPTHPPMTLKNRMKIALCCSPKRRQKVTISAL